MTEDAAQHRRWTFYEAVKDDFNTNPLWTIKMKKFGFPRSSRVTKRKEYQAIYQAGNKVVDPYLVVYFRPNQLNRVRLGISVSKKLGGAVVRNRLKRLFREVFRQNKYRYRPGYDLVCVARKPMLQLDFYQLNKRLDRVLARAGLINEVQFAQRENPKMTMRRPGRQEN